MNWDGPGTLSWLLLWLTAVSAVAILLAVFCAVGLSSLASFLFARLRGSRSLKAGGQILEFGRNM